MKKIVFVCTGNTCRSPMAEGLFKHLISKKDNLKNKYDALSAGLFAYEGQRVNDYSIRALKNLGIDISNYTSLSFSREIAKSAFLILTMTESHRDNIISLIPDARGKVFALKEYVYKNTVNQSVEIEDPFGMPYEAYEKCSQEIKHAVEELIKKID
mgnify:CR=1 FL=1